MYNAVVAVRQYLDHREDIWNELGTAEYLGTFKDVVFLLYSYTPVIMEE